MTFVSTLIAAASLAVLGSAKFDDPSREGRDLAMILMVQGPAMSTPETNLFWAKDESENFKYANRITPLGQRQQFLIGSELRRRYVFESALLSEDYIISQVFMQTPFVAKNILSTQALMMGLFPATKANDLTDWQQKNAVPPMAGVDFSEWQRELGAHALPFGLQTFPIQQSGIEADMLLSVSDKNCPYYANNMKPALDDITGQAQTAISNISYQWASYLELKSVADICSYLQWAHYNSIDLAGDEQK